MFRLNLTSLLVLCLVLLPLQAVAEVFKYRDAKGHIYLTDKPMKGPYRLLKRFSLGGKPRTGGDSLAKMRQRRRELTPMIEAAARRQRLPTALVHAVIRAESAFREDAVSHKGAIGLMQLMPATATQLGVHDPYDARQNVDGGTRYLRQLIDRFDRDLRLALAAYNAGENAVASYGNRVPPYPETQDYVAKVLTFYKEYRGGDALASR